MPNEQLHVTDADPIAIFGRCEDDACPALVVKVNCQNRDGRLLARLDGRPMHCPFCGALLRPWTDEALL